jgi:hypothetical protein
VQLRTGLQIIPGGELLKSLRLAVLEDLEILTSKVGQVLAAAVCHRRCDADELGSGAKSCLLGGKVCERRSQD